VNRYGRGVQCFCVLLLGPLALASGGEKTAAKLPAEVRKAMKDIGGKSAADRIAAVGVLAKADTLKAAPLLIKALGYRDAKLRKAVLTALKSRARSDPSVISLLVDQLGKSSRNTAIEILRALKSPKSFVPLVRVLKEKAYRGKRDKDDNPEDKKRFAREGAARLLGELGDERAIPHLVLMLGSGLLNDVEAGGKALLKFGKKGRAAMVAAIRHKDPKVGGGAAIAVSYFQEKAAKKPLLEALKDKSLKPQVRNKVAVALAMGCGDPEVVEVMIGVLAEKPPKPEKPGKEKPEGKPKESPKPDKHAREFKAMLGRMLGMMTRQDFGTDVKKWQKWWTENKKAFTKEYAEQMKRLEEPEKEKEKEKERD
jgi:HEAT repeat protein